MKGGANIAVIRSNTVAGDSSKRLITGDWSIADVIQAMEADGFQVGTDARVNANGTVYYYLALDSAAADLVTGSYTGNATDNRDITGLGFDPSLVVIWESNTFAQPVFRTSLYTGDDASPFQVWHGADMIQAFGTGSFQVGTDANTNGNSNTYHYLAVKELANAFDVLTYTGNGADDRSLTGVGFQPDFVLTKDRTDWTNRDAVVRFVGEAGDNSFDVGAVGEAVDQIQALAADGFQVGTSVLVNANASPYHVWSLKIYSGATAHSAEAVSAGASIATAEGTATSPGGTAHEGAAVASGASIATVSATRGLQAAAVSAGASVATAVGLKGLLAAAQAIASSTMAAQALKGLEGAAASSGASTAAAQASKGLSGAAVANSVSAATAIGIKGLQAIAAANSSGVVTAAGLKGLLGVAVVTADGAAQATGQWRAGGQATSGASSSATATGAAGWRGAAVASGSSTAIAAATHTSYTLTDRGVEMVPAGMMTAKLNEMAVGTLMTARR